MHQETEQEPCSLISHHRTPVLSRTYNLAEQQCHVHTLMVELWVNSWRSFLPIHYRTEYHTNNSQWKRNYPTPQSVVLSTSPAVSTTRESNKKITFVVSFLLSRDWICVSECRNRGSLWVNCVSSSVQCDTHRRNKIKLTDEMRPHLVQQKNKEREPFIFGSIGQRFT